MSHPHLSYLHALYTEELQPFRKVHRMIDLFESIIKTHTVVIIAEYVQHNQLSDTAKGLLAQGLRTPSLGTWQLFSRVLFEELQAVNYTWTLNEFASGFEFLDKSLNNDKTNVIAFRNGYAHGATPSDEQCENDIRKFEPYMEKLLSLNWLVQSSIKVTDGIVYFESAGNAISCHPIFLFRDEKNDASFAFFNDLKNDKIGLLNYPLGKHYREKEFFKVFHEYLPLNEWKKLGNNEFYQRIEELTETFKGRTFEREKLLQFVINESKGYCSIQGNPGIGKSALIAQFFKDLRASDKARHVNVVEYFIRRGTAQAQTEYLLNYLIKRTDELFLQGKEIRAEGKMVFEIQQQLFNKWRLWAEHSNGRKLLFLIDGLDEGVENNIVNYLPRENFQDILFIYGSRPGGHKTIDELWSALPLESHGKIELSGLSKEDIRALIYEVANKYDLEKDSEWIEAVQKRSQGNPLYLKLLCDSIENGGIALNDVNALPSKIDDYYKAILLRYAQDPDGDELLAGLYTFAAAKDYLTLAHLGLMNQMGDATLERIGSTLKEVLYENPLTEDVLDYQLFHESFREYLVKEKKLKVNEAKQRIIQFCGRWRELEGQWEQRYVMDHFASHLYDGVKEHHADLLLKLIYDTDFQTTQKKVLRGFEATNTLFRLALLKASDTKRFDEQLEASLCLVDLKYEEANDAPQIVAMVANGEIDLALKRIESFGGTDQDGMQRKFILYMLCLMELTLLESKTMPLRKAAIEKLLNHFDEQIPVDHSILKWNDFFSSYLMFQMACMWAELGLDYLIVFNRTDKWEREWIAEKGPYCSLQFEVLLSCAQVIISNSAKSSVFKDISVQQAKQGHEIEAASSIQEALGCAGEISSFLDKISSFLSISSHLTKQGKVEESASAMQEAIYFAREYEYDGAIQQICEEMVRQGHLKEALNTACSIRNEYYRFSAFKSISTILFQQGYLEDSESAFDQALAIAHEIGDISDKSAAFNDIVKEKVNQGKILESIEYVDYIEDCNLKNRAVLSICEILILNSQVQRAYNLAIDLDSNFAMCCLKCLHSKILFKQNKLDEASKIFTEVKAYAQQIVDSSERIIAKQYISDVLIAKKEFKAIKNLLLSGIGDLLTPHEHILQKQIVQDIFTKLVEAEDENIAFELALSMFDCDDVSDALGYISIAILKKGSHTNAIKCAMRIPRKLQKQDALIKIYKELSSKKENFLIQRLYLSMSSTSVLNEESIKELIIGDIVDGLVKKDRISPVLACIEELNSDSEKFKELFTATNRLIDLKLITSAKNLIKVCLEKYSYLFSDCYFGSVTKDSLLIGISMLYAKLGMFDQAIELIFEMNDNEWKCKGYFEIVNNFLIHCRFEEASQLTDKIQHSFFRDLSLNRISVALIKQGKFEESLAHALGISYESERISTLNGISTELAKQGKVAEAASVMQEALTCARGIPDVSDKSSALKDISTKLAKQGKVVEAASVMQEALTCARGISSDYRKSSELRDISTELAKQSKLDEALNCARGISDESKKSSALKDISTELARQGRLEEAALAMHEALTCARDISDDFWKISALKDICTERAKQGNWTLAENTGLEIPQLAERHSCWKTMAENSCRENGWQKAFEQVNQFKSDEARLFYLKGWAEAVNQQDAQNACVQEALSQLANDSESIENLLQKHALNGLFLGDAHSKKIDRLNRTLNIQWAIDIAAQFQNEETTARLSTNLETWLHEIGDEDDREQIELWAKQVGKGKITEDEFGERVKELM